MSSATTRKNAKPRRILSVAAVAFLSLTLSVACDSGQDSIENYLTRAKEFRANGDLRASVIEAKNALSVDAENQDARLLLGRNYSDIGAWAAAETMLKKAKEKKGGLEYAVIPQLMRVQLNIGKFDEVLADFYIRDDMSNSLKAEIFALRGRALTATRKFDEARASFDRGLALEEKSHNVLIGLAGLAFAHRKYDEAEKYASAAYKITPDDPEILLFRGRYALARNNYTEAKANFAELIKARPYNFRNKILFARAQLSMGETEEVAKFLDNLLKSQPNHPELLYYRAVTALRLRDYQMAATQSEQVLAVTPGNLAAMRLAGSALVAIGRYEQARSILTGYMNRVPGDKNTAKLLAEIQLKMGMKKEALSTLKPLAAQPDPDARFLSLIGAAATAVGDFDAGTDYISRLVSLEPENAKARAGLGLLRIRGGDVDEGIEELNQAVKSDGNLIEANVSLIRNFVRLQKYDLALDAALRLQSNHPSLPDGYVLAGVVQFIQKNRDAAKSSFMKAIQIDPGNPAATLGLANIYEGEERRNHATDLVKEALVHYPKNGMLLLRLAKIEARNNNLEGTEKYLAQAIEAAPTSVLPRLRSGRLNLSLGRPEKALAIIAPVLKSYPNDASLREVAGKAEMLLKRYADARVTFTKLVEIRPNSAKAHYLLAEAYKGLRNLREHILELEKAFELHNKSFRIRADLARALIVAGRLDEAGAHIADFKKAYPDAEEVLNLDGDYQYKRKNYTEAASAFAAALKTKPSIRGVTKLARTLRAAGNDDKAAETLAKWLAKRPDDLVPRLQLAELFLATERWNDSIAQYGEVAKRQPDFWIPYNQSAWLYLKIGNTDLAYQQAQKARELAPLNPVAMDTMASVLLAKGDAYRAVSLLRAASDSAPGNLDIKFNFARALVENNQKDKAQSILREILVKDKIFKERENAELLLRQLGE